MKIFFALLCAFNLSAFSGVPVKLKSVVLESGPDDLIVMVKSAKSGLVVGDTRTVTLVVEGDVKNVNLQLVDLQNKPLKTEIRPGVRDHDKLDVRVPFSVVIPSSPFRLWVVIQGLDGAYVVNKIETEVYKPGPPNPNASKIKRPADTKELSGYLLSKAYGLEIKVINQPTAKDIEKLYGKWVRSTNAEIFVESIKKNKKQSAGFSAFSGSAIFELSGGSVCRMSDDECEVKLGQERITISSKKDSKKFIEIYLTNIGPFLALKESVAVPLLPLGNKLDAIPVIEAFLRKQFKVTMNTNISTTDLEKLVGKWAEDKDFIKGMGGNRPRSSIGSFEIVKNKNEILFVDVNGAVPLQNQKSYLELPPKGQNKNIRYLALAEGKLIELNPDTGLFRFAMVKSSF